MNINKDTYVLNGLLNKGLYLTQEQLDYYVNIYCRENKMKFKEVLDLLITNNDFFIKWITDRAFKFINTL